MGAKRVKPEKRSVDANAKPKEQPQAGLLGFREWFEVHQQKVIFAVSSVFVLVLVVWGVSTFLDRKERTAQAEYAAIVKEWPAVEGADSAAWQGLQDKLERFIAQAGSTRASLFARMDLMRVLVQEKRLDEATRLATDLTAQAGSDKDVGPILRYQLGLAFDAAGKVDDAAAQWNALKAQPLPGIEREVDWRLGRYYAAKQELSKAAELLESALKSPGEYPSTALVQEDLAAVRSKATKGS